MLSQEQFRNEYAQKEGYDSWSNLMDYADHPMQKHHLNRVMTLYAKAMIAHYVAEK